MMFLYVLMVYAISWAIIIILPLNYADISMFVPGLVAIGFSLYSGRGIGQLFKRSQFRYMCFGLLVSLFAFVLYLSIVYEFHLGLFGINAPQVTRQIGSTWYALYLFFYIAVTALFEEIGWRGYLLGEVNTYVSHFLGKSLIVGLIWGELGFLMIVSYAILIFILKFLNLFINK